MKYILSLIFTFTCILSSFALAQEKIDKGINCGIVVLNERSRNYTNDGYSFGGHLIYSHYHSNNLEISTVSSLGIQLYPENSKLQRIAIPLNFDWNFYMGKEKTRGIASIGLGLNGFFMEENAKVVVGSADNGLALSISPVVNLGAGVNHSLGSNKQIDIIFEYSKVIFYRKTDILIVKFNLHFR